MAEGNGNGKRTIDERLDALTMNLELMSRTTEENGRQIGLLGGKIGQLATKIDQLTGKVDQLADSMIKLVEISNRDAVDIAALARIAEAHEHRLDRIDGGNL